ncbi:MAG: FxLYD domain-containing protein [Nitrososphaeraceae archaeon]|jgi:hypothetical protein
MNSGGVTFLKPLIRKKIRLSVHGLFFTLLLIGLAAGSSNPVTAGGVEHDYDEDRFDNFEESDLNPENENYVGDDRIRELGGTPLPRDSEDNNNGNGNSNNDNDSDIVGTVQNISQPVNILSHRAQEDRGYLHVVGEVENGLSRSIDFVKVTGTFYDVNNNVIGTDFIFTDPDTLEVGETAPFDLTFYTEAIDPSEVATYKIRVSWR